VHDKSYEKLLGLIGSEDPLASAYLAQHSLFSQAGLQRLRGGPRPPQTRFVPKSGGSSPLGRLSRLELMLYLRNTLLRDGDQMGMAHGVELRAPFVDHRLVELVVALAPGLKVDPQGLQKPLLVKAVGPLLPNEIVNRPKQGFELPYDRWLRNGLSVAKIIPQDLGLDTHGVLGVRDRFESGQNWARFWTLQVLAAWAKREQMLPPNQ
jgi:asparagine synthase (glutamine-hydrolysing)